MGAWDFELFFGAARPRVWAYAKLLDGPPPPNQSHEPGTYEVRYAYVPVVRETAGATLRFEGVRQEIVDLSTGESIAERENYVWGKDLNRSSMCMGVDWFSGNDNFLDRVLGYRYRHENPRTLTPERYVKAAATHSTPVQVELRGYTQEEVLPPGSTRDYNRRTITLPNGSSFWMPSFWQGEPIPGVATLETARDLTFVLLPDGGRRNWPLRQLMLYRRERTGEAIEKIFVQLPRFVDWSNGWGMRPQDISIDDGAIRFSVYGKKVRTGPYSDQGNAGRYLMRYDFVARI